MKQVKVKQSVRKGKLVRGYNRVLTKVTDKLFKRDKDGKKKGLSNLSKGLIGATSIVGLLTVFKYRRNIERLSEKIVNKVSPTVNRAIDKTAKTISQPITNTTGDIMAASVTGGAMTKEARRRYIQELNNLPSESFNIQPSNRSDSLITKRYKRNAATLDKRINNARGKLTEVNYNPDDDLYLAIKTNKDFSYKGATDIESRRATRKALAGKLKQQLGVNPGKSTPVKRKRGRPKKS